MPIIIIWIYFFKSNNLESSFDEEYKDVLKNQFLSCKFTLGS